MKYRKYLILIILLMIFSIDKIYAETCFYESIDVSLEYNSSSKKFIIRRRGNKTDIIADGEELIDKNGPDNITGISLKKITTECPNYIVYRRKDRKIWFDSDGIFGFDNADDQQAFAAACREEKNMYVWPASKSSSTREEFENGIIENANNYRKYGSSNGVNPNANFDGGNIVVSDDPVACAAVFDQEFMDLIDEILKYPRYIVPIIIIGLGMLDFFKAVIASKEDEMKKSQRTFIKRVIIGTCVFLVPLLIKAILWLANLAGLAACDL